MHRMSSRSDMHSDAAVNRQIWQIELFTYPV